MITIRTRTARAADALARRHLRLVVVGDMRADGSVVVEDQTLAPSWSEGGYAETVDGRGRKWALMADLPGGVLVAPLE